VLYFSAIAIFQALVERFAFLDYANSLQDVGYLFGLNNDCLALCLASPSNASQFVLGGKLSYAHVGVGSTPQLIGEMFKLQAGLPELVQVPYRGAGPAIADLISGQVAMAVMAVAVIRIAGQRASRPRGR
jgi:hypothetical protein